MKKTIEFIRSEFAKENYKLLTTEYRNNRQKLDYICIGIMFAGAIDYKAKDALSVWELYLRVRYR